MKKKVVYFIFVLFGVVLVSVLTDIVCVKGKKKRKSVSRKDFVFIVICDV